MVSWELWAPSTSSCLDKLITRSMACSAPIQRAATALSKLRQRSWARRHLVSSPAARGRTEPGSSPAQIKESVMHAGRDIFLYFCREIRSKRILSFCSARCCFVRCVVQRKGIYVFHGRCWEQIETFGTGLAAGLGVARRVGTRVKVWAGRQRWLWSTTQLAIVQFCTPMPTAVWQLGSRYNFMEKQQCFSPTFNFKKSHYVSLCTFQTMERWASSINNEILPFFPWRYFSFVL